MQAARPLRTGYESCVLESRAGALPERRRQVHSGRMTLDPAVTNPEHYAVIFENERVRVLEYRDEPGDETTPHDHPDSVMYTLSSFHRRLMSQDRQMEVELEQGTVGWLPAQRHHAKNIGETSTHVIFVELKGDAGEARAGDTGVLGPE